MAVEFLMSTNRLIYMFNSSWCVTLGSKMCLRFILAACLVCFASATRAVAAERMGCSPGVLGPDSTLVMSLPLLHGGNLHIEGPKPEAIYYTVITYDNPKTVGFRPIVRGQDFKHMRQLSLKVADILGDDLDPEQMSRPRRRLSGLYGGGAVGQYLDHTLHRSLQGFEI